MISVNIPTFPDYMRNTLVTGAGENTDKKIDAKYSATIYAKPDSNFVRVMKAVSNFVKFVFNLIFCGCLCPKKIEKKVTEEKKAEHFMYDEHYNDAGNAGDAQEIDHAGLANAIANASKKEETQTKTGEQNEEIKKHIELKIDSADGKLKVNFNFLKSKTENKSEESKVEPQEEVSTTFINADSYYNSLFSK